MSTKEFEGPRWAKCMFDNAVEFYQKDSKLNKEERLHLSKRYAAISKAEVVGIVSGFTAGLNLPFAHRYYTMGTLKGVKLPRAFLLGVVSMVLARTVAGKATYNRELRKLDPTGELDSKLHQDMTSNRTSAEKEYEVMRLLKYRAAPRWSMYFRNTYKDPENRLPDPSQRLEEFQKARRFPFWFRKKNCAEKQEK